MKVVRAGWTSASFLLYAGALIAVSGAVAWEAVISSEHSSGAFAGWSVLFWAVAEAVALRLLVKGNRLMAGLVAFVGLVLWIVMIWALFAWWDWLPDHDGPIQGFHVGSLGLELLIVLAALIDLRIWRHPLLVAIAAPAGWLFVTDVLSSGGNWTAWVTLLVGMWFFFIGIGLDGREARPYGFWVHVTAGLTIGGALLYFWHSSDAQWALIIIVALVFILVGAGMRRSSYGVLGVIGLALATGYYSGNAAIGINGAAISRPTTWAVPVAYICLGAFLALLGRMLYRGGGQPDHT